MLCFEQMVRTFNILLLYEASYLDEDNSAEINNYRLKLKSKFQKMDQPFW